MPGILIFVFIALLLFGIFIILGFRALQNQPRAPSWPLETPTIPERTHRDQGTNFPQRTVDDFDSSSPTPGPEIDQTTTQKAPPEVSKSPQGNVLLWAGMQSPLTVQGYTINDPFTYWSNGQASPDEASCLDITLPSGQPSNPNTAALPYWPRYSQITPDQRARYLSWLSTGKDRDLDEIGYAFLYFYGLERRALIETEDIDQIVHEVRRLLDRYRTSHSFNTYLEDFLGYLAAKHLDSLTRDDLTTYFPDLAELNKSCTVVALAWFAQKGTPIPWQLAYSVARHFSGTSIPSTVKEEISYLETLFQTRYLSMFENGLSVVPAKNPYKLDYHPANPSLLSSPPDTTIVPCSIPYPLRRKRQFNDLFALWERCILDLRPSLNQLSKNEGTITWQVYANLPEELRTTVPHPDQEVWDRIFEEQNEEKPWALVPLPSLAGVIGIEKRKRLTRVQSQNLSWTVHDAGYLILPDVRHAGYSYRWDETLVLLPLPATERADQNSAFSSCALMLELGLGIAASDGHIDPDERTYLRTFYGETFSLSPFEHQCLEALEDLYIHTPPSLTRLGKRLKEGLDPDTRLLVAQFLVEMATADGTVDLKEKKNLNKIFKAMGIEEGYLHWLLTHVENPDPADVPVTVQSETMPVRGEPLPPLPVEISPSFTIDRGAVARIMDETREVSEILGEVFTKEETEPGEFVFEGEEDLEEPEAQITSPSDHDGIEGLQPRYVPVLEELLVTEVWTRDEFVHLVQCHHCMPQATIEAINVWSEEHLGDFLLEDDQDMVVVNQSLITR